MIINLNEVETEKLKLFFTYNSAWMRTKDFSKEQDLIELVNKYGEFLEKNNLSLSRNLLMLLVELKQDLLRIKISPPNLKQRRRRMHNNLDRNSCSTILTKWNEILYPEISHHMKENLSNSELDAITEMLAVKIMEREKGLEDAKVVDEIHKEGVQKTISIK